MSILKSPTRVRAAIAAVLALAVPAAGLVAPAAPAAAQATDKLTEAVAALRSISTMRADFTQTDRAGQSLRGVLTLKSPGKIRFEYEKAANMLIVSNGRTLTMVDYDVKQLQRWPIGNSPLGALLNPNKDVARYGRLMPTANPNVTSVSVKDPKKPEYGSITMIFVKNAAAPGGLELNSWVAQDAQNKLTTVRLTNQRYGVPVAENAFTYSDPTQKLGPRH